MPFITASFFINKKVYGKIYYFPLSHVPALLSPFYAVVFMQTEIYITHFHIPSIFSSSKLTKALIPL